HLITGAGVELDRVVSRAAFDQAEFFSVERARHFLLEGAIAFVDPCCDFSYCHNFIFFLVWLTEFVFALVRLRPAFCRATRDTRCRVYCLPWCYRRLRSRMLPSIYATPDTPPPLP